MDTKTLKSGFFGYSKTSVYEYIAKMNEEFSQKLIDAMAENEQTQKELREKLTQLEKENLQLRNAQNDVAAILLDAKGFAAELNAKAEAEDRKMRADNIACRNAELSRIRSYSQNIDAIRRDIRKLLETMDAELTKEDQQLSALEEGVLADEPQPSDSEKTTSV